ILKQSGAASILGGNFDTWDFSISGGLFGTVRVVAMVEEHGNGRQLFRFRAWPKPPAPALAVFVALISFSGLAGLDHAWVASVSLGLTAGALGLLIYADCAIAMAYWCDALDQYFRRNPSLSIVG